MLVVQNSSLFVVTRYSRLPTNEDPVVYLSSAVVLVVELCKMCICLAVIATDGKLFHSLQLHIWTEREQTMRLAVPAICYALQNNLVFIAISNLSAAAAQVLYQMKTLTTAIFSVLLLGRSFHQSQWASFVLLTLGVILVQSQDAKSTSGQSTGASPAIGVVAALTAATLSGFAGVYLEKMYTSGSSSLWMRNVQLGIFAIPLQLVAIYRFDGDAVSDGGLLQGFRPSTWMVVLVQVVGALLTAFVIKFAGNVLKTFATVLALLCTCFVSTLIFDFQPTPLFALGVAATALSIYLYSYPSLRATRAVEVEPQASVPLIGSAGSHRQCADRR
jgi:UDP-sugar transporter A1/2/3